MRLFKGLMLVLLLLAIASPMGIPSANAQAGAKVSVSSSPELGKFLVGEGGFTLYMYPPDKINESTCYDKCADSWPPFIVESLDKLSVEDGIPGKFDVTKRTDNSMQVTYNGMPLYYWFKDAKAGDTTGHRVGRIWWVVAPATVYAKFDPKLGSILAGPAGMTLYMFTKDTAGVSNCYDQCATNWPPLTVKSADEIVPGVNLVGKFGTAARKDGSLQVTYNDMPLYYWKDDKAIGDASGENVGEVWFTVVAETIGTANNKDLGDFLVTPDGMTLYAFANDTPGVSNCAGDCAKAWPPYTVREGERLAGGALKGELSTIKREDGGLQVAYNGVPLYLFAKDTKPGDATGQNVGNKWVVVKP